MTDATVPEAANLPLQPLADYILAQEDREGARAGGGMILPSNTLGQPAFAVVKDVGEDAQEKFKPGDIIVYRQAEAVPVYVVGKEYLLVKAGAVMAKLKKSHR